MTGAGMARKPAVTCDNGGTPSSFDLPVDTAMSRLRRVLSRRRRPVARPWEYERLATPKEIAELTKTDMRRAA